jgi:hypothetical protein
MTVRGSRVAPFTAAVLAAACLSTTVRAQVQLRIDGDAIQVQGNAIQVQGNVVVVPGGGPFPAGVPAGVDPWWTADDEAAPGAAAAPAAPQAPVVQPAQVRLAQARRARAESVLVRELSRVREACPGLEPAERAAVLAAGRATVEDQAAGRSPLVNGVETALEQALQEAAGPEVAVGYAEEVASRVARRKAAAIAVIVEAVDRDALLDDEERRAVALMLTKRWQPEWESVAATALRQRVTFARLPPGVPAAVSVALDLDPETVAAWRARAVEPPR